MDFTNCVNTMNTTFMIFECKYNQHKSKAKRRQ